MNKAKIEEIENKLEKLKMRTVLEIDACISDLRSLKRARSESDIKRKLSDDHIPAQNKKIRLCSIAKNKHTAPCSEDRNHKKAKTLTSYLSDMKL